MSYLKISTTLVLLCTTVLVACGKNNDNNNTNSNPPNNGGAPNGQVASVPVPTVESCMQQARPEIYSGPEWQPYHQAGCVPYSYGQDHYQYGYEERHRYPRGVNRNRRGGFVGCPQGYITACDSRVGMHCVPTMTLNRQNYQVAWYGYNTAGANFSFCGYAGYSGAYGGGCANFAVSQGCLVGTNSCGYGLCQPVAHGSAVGVCVQ